MFVPIQRRQASRLLLSTVVGSGEERFGDKQPDCLSCIATWVEPAWFLGFHSYFAAASDKNACADTGRQSPANEGLTARTGVNDRPALRRTLARREPRRLEVAQMRPNSKKL